MKRFSAVPLAAVALLLPGIANASAIYYAGMCGDFFAGNFSGPPNAVSGSWTCPSAASLGVSGPLSGEFLVYDSDYSNGLAPDVTTVTNWTFSGADFAFSTDTTTVTGDGFAGAPVSSDGLSFNSYMNLPPGVLAGFYDIVDNTSGFGTPVVQFSSSPTVGSAIESTGYAEVVYFVGTDSAPVPEPSGPIPIVIGGVIAMLLARARLKSLAKSRSVFR